MKNEIVPRQVGSFLVPLVLLYGLYVIFHGEIGPGGGFQGGVILASGLILFALVHGVADLRKALSQKLTTGLAAIGLLIYALTGVAAMVRGGNFLEHSTLVSNTILSHHLGIGVVELGIGITVASVMLTIFEELYED